MFLLNLHATHSLFNFVSYLALCSILPTDLCCAFTLTQYSAYWFLLHLQSHSAPLTDSYCTFIHTHLLLLNLQDLKPETWKLKSSTEVWNLKLEVSIEFNFHYYMYVTTPWVLDWPFVERLQKIYEAKDSKTQRAHFVSHIMGYSSLEKLFFFQCTGFEIYN